MRVLLFDADGNSQRTDTPSFRKATATHGGSDLIQFYVVNAGWLAVSLRPASFSVAVRPMKAADPALAAALYYLSDLPEIPCELWIYSGQEASQYRFTSSGGLIQALCAAISEARMREHERFRRRTVEREGLSGHTALQALVSQWEELAGEFDIERMWRSLMEGVRGRFAVVRQDPDCLRISQLGKGILTLPHYYPTKSHSNRLKDQYDAYYGEWVSNAYEEAIVTDLPLMEQVDCHVNWPYFGTLRHRYWRVILPFCATDGSQLALGVTLPDANIDLSGMGHVQGG